MNAVAEAVAETQYCTFLLGPWRFGVPVEQVHEVLASQSLTRVPLVPGVIRGLMNLRGQIVPVIDLRRRLEVALGEPNPQPPMQVVVYGEDGLVSLLVDEIGEVLALPPNNLHSAPATLQGPLRDLILGAYKLPRQLLLILNVARVLEIE